MQKEKPCKMAVERLSSCDPGNQAKVWCTWTSPTCVLNKPEESVVLFIWVKRKVHTVLFPSTFLPLPCFFLTVFVSVSVPSPHVFFLPYFIFIIKQVSWILHRKRCCFKQSVMSAFLWRKSNKLSSENKCFESLDLTCMCFFYLWFVTHFFFCF